jgi:hypothetical protein
MTAQRAYHHDHRINDDEKFISRIGGQESTRTPSRSSRFRSIENVASRHDGVDVSKVFVMEIEDGSSEITEAAAFRCCSASSRRA